MDGVFTAFSLLLAFVLLTLAGFNALAQVRSLRRLHATAALPDSESRHLRHRAARRLGMGALMATLAFMLPVPFLFGLERGAEELIAAGAAHNAAHPDAPARMTDEQKAFTRTYSAYWLSVVLLTLVLMFLAAYDLFAVRREALRHLRALQNDQREAIERQLAIYRSQRNGKH